MIVMLALLNDGAILSIAYDNVQLQQQARGLEHAPRARSRRRCSASSVSSPAFGLFYLGDRVFHSGHPQLQTLMYLKLSVAGHLTIFLTRTRGPWWSIRPAKILLFAVLGTQAFATLMAVYGLHIMTPIGWGWAGFVWGYALICALLTDPDKTARLSHSRPDRPSGDPKKPARRSLNRKPQAAAAMA